MTEDEPTIKRILEGETEAFRAIVEKYQKPVFGMIFQLIQDRETARDLTQEVFLAAFRNLSRYDPHRARFSTWLYAIARNQARNARRKKSLDYMSDPPELADNESPATAARRRETFQALDAALDRLPEKMRRPFVFAELEGLPYEEISRIEAVSIGTVKSRISRARKRLRQSLQSLKTTANEHFE